MFCENCGTKIPDNSSFCEECGNKVSFLENETNINEENLNKKRESGSNLQRGSVPPVMRTTTPRQPSESYGKRAVPRQPSEPYGKEAVPRQPSKPYGRETRPLKPSESYIGGTADIISFGQYVFMIVLSGIPIVNIILFVKWGFFNKQSPNKSNFAKALLFYYLIAVIIYVAYIYLWLKATSSI